MKGVFFLDIETDSFKKEPHLCYGCNKLCKFEELWRYCNCRHPNFPRYRGICKQCAEKYSGRLVQELPYAPNKIRHHYLLSTDPSKNAQELQTITNAKGVNLGVMNACTFDVSSGVAPDRKEYGPGLIRNKIGFKVNEVDIPRLEKDPEITFPCFICNRPASSLCSGCSRIHYCSSECQRQDWQKHKPFCIPQKK